MTHPYRFLLLAVAALVVACNPGPSGSPGSSHPRPNVLLIVTDDQPVGTLDVMPATRRWFARRGTTFTRAYTAIPRCCPSRASIMTGRYAHNHGVLTNDLPERLDHGTTLQRHLQDAGYLTAITGKFLNNWPLRDKPPYFHEWSIMNRGYYGARFNVGGRVRNVRAYSTAFLLEQARKWLDEFEKRKDSTPWFLYVAPFAPHYPWQVPRAFRDAPVGRWNGDPAVLERDRSDKPPFVRAEHVDLQRGRLVRRRQLRTLMPADEELSRLFGRLQKLDETGNTLAVFVSDNGHLWGHHGLTAKGYPYLQSVQVPLMIAWPGRVAAGATDRRLVSTVDLAPTIADAVGLDALRSRMDGRSLLEPRGRSRLLIEHWHRPGGQEVPDWAATVTAADQYVEHYRGGGVIFREYYNLERDPWQLTNLLAGGRVLAGADRSAALLSSDRKCARSACP